MVATDALSRKLKGIKVGSREMTAQDATVQVLIQLCHIISDDSGTNASITKYIIS